MRLIDADELIKKLDGAMDTNSLASMVIVNALITLIAKQPTVTDTNVGCNWIPVSERLPDDYGNYLVSTNDDRVLECDIGTYCYWDGKWNGCDANGFVRDIDVVAWMPLPEPMRLEENDG